MFALASSLFAFVLAATATPVIRQDSGSGPNCDVFGANGFATSDKNFTLAAWSKTGPNANTTGVPLVVGAAGAIPGASLKQLSTYATFPYDSLSPFSLSEGTVMLGGIAPEDQSARPPAADSGPFWLLTTVDTPEPTHAYCGVNNADSTGLPLLAVYGSTDGFSLCKGNSGTAQTTVVWNASSTRTECDPVNLHILYV